MGILEACVLFLRAMSIPEVHLIVENLALRQQLAVLGQSVKRPKLRTRDRGQIHGLHSETAFSDLANLPGQSCS